MLAIICNLAVLLVLTLHAEYLWRAKKISAETARKSLHVIGGVMAAFGPLYMTWDEVRFVIVVSIAAIIFMRVTGLVKSFFSVERKTYGDILGPATIVLLIFLSPPTALYILIVLNMTLADGAAALIGKRFGKTNSYKVFGYKKSVVGTFACCAVSLFVTTGVFIIGQFDGTVTYLSLAAIPIAVTAAENVSIYGIDNTLIAVVAGLLGRAFGLY